MLTPARGVAFKVLLRVEREASYAVELLNSRLGAELSPADRGLAQEIVMGCIRWQAQLDWLAERLSGRSAARLDAEVRIALRIGIYQMRFLERIPVSAAVDQSVELVKRAGKRSAAGLVNAVLRKVTREPIETLLPLDMPEAERRPILLSHPAWLLDRWAQCYGAERAEAIALVNNQPPPLFVRLPPGTAAGFGVPCRYVRDCREVTGQPPAGLVIQDQASQIVPHLLEPQAGQRILDLCAAPGIKTGAIRELAPHARLVACDLHAARLRLVEELAGGPPSEAGRWAETPAPGGPPSESHWPAIDCVALDGTRPLPFGVTFDRILVDAPCSGTGTIRRNPEIKWRLKEPDLAILAARQRWLLSNALDWLAPGGRLVYSTCSIEPEENRQVVEEVLKGRNDCCFKPVEEVSGDFLAEAGRILLRGRFLETLPDQGVDGFFAALIEKSGGPSLRCL